MKISVIIAAGGIGKRMNLKENKLLINLDGMPIIARTVSIFEKNPFIDEIVLVVPKKDFESIKKIVKDFNYKKVSKIVEGGETRQDSVFNGLTAVDTLSDLVVIHDGARPFLTNEILEKVIERAKKTDAAIVAVKVKDTVKQVNSSLFIEKTLDRNLLWQAQTPQVFKTSLIKEIYKWAKDNNLIATDDASLAESYGVKVSVVEGSYENIKITTKEDLMIGEAILSSKR